jgi:hypothetical protein
MPHHERGQNTHRTQKYHGKNAHIDATNSPDQIHDCETSVIIESFSLGQMRSFDKLAQILNASYDSERQEVLLNPPQNSDCDSRVVAREDNSRGQ